MYSLLKMEIFHCYVSLLEGRKNTFDAKPCLLLLLMRLATATFPHVFLAKSTSTCLMNIANWKFGRCSGFVLRCFVEGEGRVCVEMEAAKAWSKISVSGVT